MKKKPLGLVPLLIFPAVSMASFDEDFGNIDATFVTPAHMTSSYRNSPNAVSVLDADLLEALGITSFTDAMRLVPGMVVAENHGSASAIGYHGTNVHVPRRTQVLLNSNRLYRAGYADMMWERLPIEPHDLERIEIVRGTSSADWGSNAFNSTVNMIQRPVALAPDGELYARVGEGGERQYLGATSFDLGESVNGLRVSYEESDGFDFSPQTEGFTDSYRGKSAFYNGEVRLDSGNLLDWYVSGSKFTYEFPTYDNLNSDNQTIETSLGGFSNYGDNEETTLSANLKYSGASQTEDHSSNWFVGFNVAQFQREQDLRFCFPGFFYDPTLEQLDAADNIHIAVEDAELLFGSSLMYGVGMLDKSLSGPVTPDQQELLVNFAQVVQSVGPTAMIEDQCGAANQDVEEDRYSVTGRWARDYDKLSFSTAAYLTHDVVTSQAYLAGEHSRTGLEISNNVRYELTDALVMNAGFLAETNSDIDGTFVSPRIALNYAFTNNHIGRILAARSHRLPGIHETERQWQYQVEFFEPDYLGREQGRTLRVSKGADLDPEINDTLEIGYTYMSPGRKFLFDTKIFREQYDNLISEPFSYIQFDLSNSAEADIEGAEAEVAYTASGTIPVRVGAVFTYLDNDASVVEERTLYSSTFGSVYAVIPVNNWSLGLAYFGSENMAKNSYDRFDVNLRYEFAVAGVDATASLNYRHYPNDQAVYTEYSSVDPLIFGYESSDRVAAAIHLAF